ncbi:MAG TPA: hypothetical protein VFF13_04445, partial [archaeon]|nr:hypothetical protein [archaeon]
HETYVNIANHTFPVGNYGKFLVEYDADSAGAQITLEFDEGSAGSLFTYLSSNGTTYQVNEAKNVVMLILNTSGTCNVTCTNDLACNDAIATTTDTCNRIGACNSTCSNIDSGITIECNLDSDCDDGNSSTTDACSNPGTESSCTNTQIDSGEEDESEEGTSIELTVENNEIICSSNSNCDDGAETTVDECKNAGLVTSYCSNAQCRISCTGNESCDDGNPITNDACLNAGTCGASCNNSSCNPLCTTSADCDDGDSTTTDVCTGAGRCTATCQNLTTIGNGTCDPEETKCSAPSECGGCGGSINDIFEFACIGNSCQQTIKLGVCGNSRCESGENYFTCEADCKPREILIESSFPDTFYVRGENVQVKATVVVDGQEVTGAQVRAQGFFGSIALFNDGRHDEGTRNDNVYANYFIINRDVDKQLYPIIITAELGGVIGKKSIFINVVPKLSFSVQFDKEFYILGDNLKMEGTLGRKTIPVNLPIDLNFEFEERLLADENLFSENGKFSANYRTTLIDNDGNYIVTMTSFDENGNIGILEKNISVLSSEATNFLIVGIGITDSNAGFKKGSIVTITSSVKDVANNPIENAIVTGTTASGLRFDLVEVSTGFYEGNFLIENRTKNGELGIQINAAKQSKQGSASSSINVVESNINLEIIEPKTTNFLAGEEIIVRVKAGYEDGSPVVTEKILANVNNKTIELKGIDKGIYEGTYIVDINDQGSVSVKIGLDDGYDNQAEQTIVVEVTGISYLYYLRTSGISIVLFVVAGIITLFFGLRIVKKITGIDSLKKREKRLIETIKGIQTQYFVEGSTDKKTYDKYMEKYESELDDVRASIHQAQLKGKK